MVCGDLKDSPRGATFDKVLHITAFNIAKDPKYDAYQLRFASIV